ncbi:MAG: tripartite tricarboxylate transporter substrate-binding protein, partial [Betaproteobacteria bacterium]
HVPYKGSSQALTDLISGQVQVMFDNFLFQLPQIKANNVKALAITSKRRSPLLPDVPTMAEVGVQGFDYGPWFGIVAPAKTPQFIIAKINSDINAVLQMKDVQDKLQGAEILGGTSLQFAVFMEKDIAKWAKLIRELNLKAD